MLIRKACDFLIWNLEAKHCGDMSCHRYFSFFSVHSLLIDFFYSRSEKLEKRGKIFMCVSIVWRLNVMSLLCCT